METIFWICVEIMIRLSNLLGVSYQFLNVLLFVILHPLLTLYFYFLYRKYKARTLKAENK
ncbi:MAG TPA: hypothetical protein VLZ72_04860 [Flavobacterium sp.]|nr:hypothetical protein [Flavobacterium sp.]